jgi:hypothetical protein
VSVLTDWQYGGGEHDAEQPPQPRSISGEESIDGLGEGEGPAARAVDHGKRGKLAHRSEGERQRAIDDEAQRESTGADNGDSEAEHHHQQQRPPHQRPRDASPVVCDAGVC